MPELFGDENRVIAQRGPQAGIGPAQAVRGHAADLLDALISSSLVSRLDRRSEPRLHVAGRLPRRSRCAS